MGTNQGHATLARANHQMAATTLMPAIIPTMALR
jgi:hypothetical protein